MRILSGARLRPGAGLRVSGAKVKGVASGGSGVWPLKAAANNRSLEQQDGTPIFLTIDTAWCAPQQLTTAQMDAYVASCVSYGFNGIIVELIESAFSDNAPATIDNIQPFTTTNDFGTPNESYFARVDYLVQKCKDNGITVLMWPLYVGLQPTGDQGWSSQYDANTQAKREGWGTFVGNRYKPFGNVIFVHGGDGTVSSFTSINYYINKLIEAWPENTLHSYHAARTVSAYTAANGQSWLTLNNTYIDSSDPPGAALTEYNRSPTRPVFLIEDYYDTAGGSIASGIINAQWQSLCSGCLAGVAYGHTEIWTFGGPGFQQNFADYYDDAARPYMLHIRSLINLYDWWKLAPTVDASLVTTSLGSTTSKICPMLASDATFAWIYSPGSNFTLNRAAFSSAHSNIRIREYNTTTGAFSTISASVPASGTQAITLSGARVVVVDGA